MTLCFGILILIADVIIYILRLGVSYKKEVEDESINSKIFL